MLKTALKAIKSLFVPAISPDKLAARQRIMQAEEQLSRAPGAMKGDCFPLQHSFADKMYIREIDVPANSLVVTKIHKVSHPFFVLKGVISVFTEDGPTLIRAPYYGITPAGTKRVCYIHEDTVWITCHVTKHTDLDKIEDEVIAKTFDDVPGELPRSVMEFIKKLQPAASAKDTAQEKDRYRTEFRELTKRVIAKEKYGFWSDWTEEQRRLYQSGDWRAFSESRGYSREEIAEFSEWVDMLEKGGKAGYAPLDMIRDLSVAAAAKNMALDKKGEILLSSHIPTNSLYSNEGDQLCHG